MLLHTTAVVACYVVNKRKVRREETPTILRKKRIGFAVEKRKKEKKKHIKKHTKNCQEEHLESKCNMKTMENAFETQ